MADRADHVLSDTQLDHRLVAQKYVTSLGQPVDALFQPSVAKDKSFMPGK